MGHNVIEQILFMRPTFWPQFYLGMHFSSSAEPAPFLVGPRKETTESRQTFIFRRSTQYKKYLSQGLLLSSCFCPSGFVQLGRCILVSVILWDLGSMCTRMQFQENILTE